MGMLLFHLSLWRGKLRLRHMGHMRKPGGKAWPVGSQNTCLELPTSLCCPVRGHVLACLP